MKKVFKKTAIAAATLAALTTMTSCDNSGQVIPAAGEFETKVFGKAIDGYLVNANVCLDIHKTYTCTDESIYLGQTDSTGSFDLGIIPNTELNKYNIVVESTDETYDVSDLASNEKMLVGLGKILVSPGYLAGNINSTEGLVITPLLSLSAKPAMDNDSNVRSFYNDVLQFLELDETIDITQIDYIKHQHTNNAFKALKLFNEALFKKDSYHAYLKGGVFTRDELEGIKNDIEVTLNEKMSDAVTIARIEETLVDGIVTQPSFGASLLVDNKQKTVQPNTTIIHDAASGSIMMKSVIKEDNLHPGLFPALGVLVNAIIRFWPDPELNYNKLYAGVSEVVKQEIANAFAADLASELYVNRLRLQEFLDKKEGAFQDAYKSNRALLFKYSAPTHTYRHLLIPQLVVMFQLHMVLCKERYLTPEILATNETKEAVLEEWVGDYLEFKRLLFQGGGGRKAIFEEFIDYRNGKIVTNTKPISWGLAHNVRGKVNDSYTNYGFEVKHHALFSPHEDFYVPTVNNIRHRLNSIVKLELAKQLSGAFLVSRLFPENMPDDLLVSLDITEKLGPEKAYFIPELFKEIEIASISKRCLGNMGDTDGACLDGKGYPYKIPFAQKTEIDGIVDINSEVIKWISRDQHHTYNHSEQLINNFKITYGTQKSELIGGQQAPNPDLDDSFSPGEGFFMIGFNRIGFRVKYDNASSMQEPEKGVLLEFTPVFSKEAVDGKSETKSQSIGNLGWKNVVHFSPPIIGSEDYRVTGLNMASPSDKFNYIMKLRYSYFLDGDALLQ